MGYELMHIVFGGMNIMKLHRNGADVIEARAIGVQQHLVFTSLTVDLEEVNPAEVLFFYEIQ